MPPTAWAHPTEAEVREVSRSLEESLPLPIGDLAYWRDPPLTSSFAEERSGMLEVLLAPLGPHAGPGRPDGGGDTNDGGHRGRPLRA